MASLMQIFEASHQKQSLCNIRFKEPWLRQYLGSSNESHGHARNGLLARLRSRIKWEDENGGLGLQQNAVSSDTLYEGA